MRQGQNGRRPRGRHHGGGGGGGHNGGGGHSGGGHVSGGSGAGNMGGRPDIRDNRPRSASSLRHQTFDSNCNDLRVRGNAWQVHEKYQALARDAQGSGDRVAAENFLQHAEHYFRIIEAINEATAAEQQARGVTPTANPGPPQQFGQQPEVPNNYYGTGNPQQGQQQQPPGNPNNSDGSPSSTSNNPAPMEQAEVQQRNPPQQQGQNPFFASEDTDEQGGPAPLVARR